MTNERIPIIKRISQEVRQGTVLDVYKIAAEVAKDFPGMPIERLEQIVTEEVIHAHGNAVWERKTG
jgi:hypothetical protein